MKNKNRTKRAVSVLLVSGMLLGAPAVNCKAAVITSNATDKAAVLFNENTAYSAGDYVIFDGELYICTSDIQGAWSEAETSFMQITKNHELGKSEELSAAYDALKDPSEENSLMAFAANVWQKLKAFLGTDDSAADLGAADYKNASVSAKLNFLEQQNEQLKVDIGNLQGSVTDSFQSVSSGKSNLANAITDEGGTAGSSDTFGQFCDAVHNLAQAQHEKGHDEGYSEGYSKGKSDGITEADKRVNTESESYKQGLKDSDMKECYMEVRLDYDGPDGEEGCFTSSAGATNNHKRWDFCKRFDGHTIYTVIAYQHRTSSFGNSEWSQVAIRNGGSYQYLSDRVNGTSSQPYTLSVTSSSVSWSNIQFNVIDGDYVTMRFRIMYI